MMPQCPKCHRTMSGGAPHGPWAVQFECHLCNYYQHDDEQRPLETKADDEPGRWQRSRWDDEDDD